MSAGYYYVLVAWRGLNCTGLGIAFYDDKGSLAGSRFAGVEEAIRRGDLPDNFFARTIEPDVPLIREAMEKRLETIANSMSVVQWRVGGASLVWNDEAIDRTFAYAVEGKH